MKNIFDLRFVIGLFFSIIGIMLFIYSFISEQNKANAETLNRWCGAGFAAFGILMIILSLRQDATDEILKEDVELDASHPQH
jgi:hypothetical protein